MSKWVMVPVGITKGMWLNCPPDGTPERLWNALVAARPALSSLPLDDLRAIAAEANRIVAECENLLNEKTFSGCTPIKGAPDTLVEDWTVPRSDDIDTAAQHREELRAVGRMGLED